jgi:WD40 repeat protein
MKRVVGRPLDAVVREAAGLEDRLALLPKVLAVAEAMAYAHEQGVIHRDLKPANVLVGAFGETVVVDWGLAKDLLREGGFEEEGQGPEVESRDGLTVVGTVMGTPAYMAPEQARGERVDERADVYALGAILYTVLAGSAPYVGPSSTAVLEAVLKGPPVPLEERQGGLPEDLLALVRKAMSVAKGERYRTAREFAEDLRRYQTGQLVGAHRYSAGQILRRWVRKHRATVAVAAAGLLALGVGGVVAFRRVQGERDIARWERSQAQAARLEADARSNDLVLSQARMLLERDPTGALAWLKLYPTEAPNWGVARSIASDARRRGIAREVLKAHESFANDVEISADGSRVVSGGADRRVVLWDLRTRSSQTLGVHSEMVVAVTISPDGQWVASSGGDGVRLWKASGGDAPGRLVLDTSQTPQCQDVAFTPQGDALACAARRSPVRVIQVGSGAVRRFGGADDDYGSVHYSPDGRSMAAESSTVVDVWRDGVARRFVNASVAAFSTDGTALALGRTNGEVEIWDVAMRTSRTLGRHAAAVDDQKARAVRALAFSGRSPRLAASVGADRTVRLWNAASGVERVVGTLRGSPWGVAFTHADEGLLTLDSEDGMRLWTLATGAGGPASRFYVPADSRALEGHANRVDAFAVSEDGSRIVSAGEDGVVRLWEVPSAGAEALNAGEGLFCDVAFSTDGRLAAAARHSDWPKGPSGTRVWLWDRESGALAELPGSPVLPWNVHAEMQTRALVFSPDASRLAVLSQNGKVYLHFVRERTHRELVAHRGAVTGLAFGREVLATAGEDAVVRLWSQDGEPRGTLSFPGNKVSALALSRDGGLLAAAGWDGTLALWDTESQGLRRLPKSHFGIRSLAFAPSGGLLASSHQDGEVKTWDLESGTLARRLPGHELLSSHVTFSPDGSVLASSGVDGTIRLWDVASGACRVLRGHGMNVGEIDFSPDGRSLVSAGIRDAAARVWDVSSGASRLLPHVGLHNVHRARFSADGTLVLTAASEGIRVWRDDLPSEPRLLKSWLETSTDLHPQMTYRNP